MLKYLKSNTEPDYKRHKALEPHISVVTKKNNMISKIKNINIPTTDLASLCGMDHYNNWNKSICRIWKQLYPNDYKEVENIVRHNGDFCAMDSNTKKINTIQLKSSSNINTINDIKTLNNEKHNNVNGLLNGQNKIKDNILSCDKMSVSDKNEIIKLMHSATNVYYGTNNEARGIDAFINITKKQIKSSQSKLSYLFAKDTIHNDNLINWYITGKYDGLTNNNEIVEIKNRQRRLFNEIRDYEMCQLQTYLHILKYDKAYLVEILGGKNNNNNVSILETTRNRNYFTDILKTYLDNIRKFVINIPYMDIDDKYLLITGKHRFGF